MRPLPGVEDMSATARKPYKTIKLPAYLVNDTLVVQWGLGAIPPVLVNEAKLSLWKDQRALLNELTKTLSRGSNPRHLPATGGKTPDAVRISLGQDIFETLINSDRISAWNKSSNPAEAHVRLVFEYDGAAAERMAQIPLEGLCSGRPMLTNVADELVLARVSIVRQIRNGRTLKAVDLEPPMKVLVFAPKPASSNQQALDIEAELEGMRTVEKESAGAIQFHFVEPGKATFARLANEPAEFHVFHFCGHGDVSSRGGRLLFENQDRTEDWRDVSQVIQLLANQNGRNTRLVVLNGCETAAVSVFATEFPAVVGMQFRISDEAAKHFADGFYRELAASGHLDDAVWMARRKMNENHSPYWSEHITPVLYMNSEDGLVLRVAPKLLVWNLENLEIGRPYDRLLEAHGGRPPYRWEADNLPNGMRLDPETGRLHGAPSAAGATSIRVRVKTIDGVSSEAVLPLNIRGGTLQILDEIIE
jgi:hypothetical protein